MTQVVTCFNQDISSFVSKLPNLVQASGEIGQLIVNDIPEITGINTRGFWDVNNPVSPFYGVIDYGPYILQITVNDILYYNGSIQQIHGNPGDINARVELKSPLQKALDSGVIYESLSPETPAQAVKNVCEEYQIPIDTGSFAVSEALYQSFNVFIEVVAPDPNLTLMNLLQNLADIGVARIYCINGVLYFNVYDPDSLPPSIYTFSDRVDNADGLTIFTHPISEIMQKDKTVGYSVQTVEGPASTGTNSDRGKQITADATSVVRVLSLEAGNWIGGQWLLYLNKAQNRITFKIPSKIGRVLPLGAAVTLEYTTGGWLPLIIDIISIDNSSKVASTIIGISR